jgi:phosphopantothenoylcysteine decarboxylase/phosphopantothenate--cysteine ligase
VATLRSRGVIVLEPASGRLTGQDTGKGRLPDPDAIFEVVRRLLRGSATAGASLVGQRVVITAGGTREPLDPVRFLGNRSSGKQGYALARTAVTRGGEVTLISANVTLPDPAGVSLVRVGTTEELRQATVAAAADANVVVMAAAPSDFRPAEYQDSKIKKSDDGSAPVLRLVTNPDIAAELGQLKRDGQLLVAFAAETGDALAHARPKLVRKNADLIVVNEVGVDKVFGQETNSVTVLGADGSVTEVAEAGKDDIADAIWDLVARYRPTPVQPSS